MNISVCLILIHLREGGKEVLQVLGGCRVAMGSLGPMDEGHDESSGRRGVGRG